MRFLKDNNPLRPRRIVITSYPHTGSTLLSNLVHGALAPQEKTRFRSDNIIGKNLITKTHNVNINSIIRKYIFYDIYFIVSERTNHRKIDDKYRKYKKVLIINYDDIVENEEYKLTEISDFILKKLRNFLPDSVFATDDDCVLQNQIIERIENMNKRYEEIKNREFSYVDKFYGIHGSHRGRSG